MLNVNLCLTAPGGVHKSVHSCVTQNGLEMDTTQCLSVAEWTNKPCQSAAVKVSLGIISKVMYNNMDIAQLSNQEQRKKVLEDNMRQNMFNKI